MKQASPWNGDQLFASKSVEWGTPIDLFQQMNREFMFSMDACASAGNAKCPVFLDREEDALSTDWSTKVGPGQSVWMNPPWGRDIGKFLQRAVEESTSAKCICVALVPAATDTQWWRNWVWMSSEVRLIVGRLRFVRDDGHTGPCPKGAALAIFTPWSFGPPKVFMADRTGRVAE